MGYIYLITNKIDNKQYIGQTIENDVYDRWKGHLKSSSNCIYLKRAFQKYKSENFKFEIICICFDSDCNIYEEDYIKKFNTLVPNGYNLKQGGNSGGKQHPETKKKISDKLKEYYKNYTEDEKEKYREKYLGKNNPMFGKKMSDEQKEKMSKITKENWKNGIFNKINEKRKKKVNCYLLDGELIATFDSLSEAMSKTNILKSDISLCCLNKRKQSKGFLWKFVN